MTTQAPGQSSRIRRLKLKKALSKSLTRSRLRESKG